MRPISSKTGRRGIRGATLIETLTAATLTVLVLFTGIMVMVSGMNSWAQGQARINAEMQSQRAVRAIANQLRQAMSVTVDANGKGLTFRLPQKDGSGSYIVPAVWDGVTRRIEVSNGKVNLIENGATTTLCNNVILTDPKSLGGTAPYTPFTAGAGSIVRQITVMVATRWNGKRDQLVSSRIRETIYLRNIPQLSK